MILNNDRKVGEGWAVACVHNNSVFGRYFSKALFFMKSSHKIQSAKKLEEFGSSLINRGIRLNCENDYSFC